MIEVKELHQIRATCYFIEMTYMWLILPSSLTARIITTNRRTARSSNDETFSGLRKSPETSHASKKTDTVINGRLGNRGRHSLCWGTTNASKCLAVEKFPVLIQYFDWGKVVCRQNHYTFKGTQLQQQPSSHMFTGHLKESYLVRNYTEFSNDNCDRMFGELARFFKDYVFL